MHSLLDVLERPRALEVREGAPGMPASYPAKPFLNVPGVGKVALPKTADGLKVWADSPATGALVGADADVIELSRVALLTDPSFVIALPDLDVAVVEAHVRDSKFKMHARGSAIVTAVEIEVPNGRLFGVARTELIQNAAGFGQSVIYSHSETWVDAVIDLADLMAAHLQEVLAPVVAPEPGSAPWKKAVLVLAGSNSTTDFTADRRIHFRRVAGLFRVDLTTRSDVQAQRAKVIANLRSAPPDGLLIMTEALADSATFKSVYLAARPDGYADDIDASSDKLDDQIDELCFHLLAFHEASVVSRLSAYPTSWTDAVAYVEGLESSCFELTERARRSIADNPYPLPARMCEHLAGLADLAGAYENSSGDLGLRLEDYAKLNHKLNMSLFDNSREIAKVNHDGAVLDPRPHVQVDDGTTFDKCGRIYFAIDSAGMRFVVDHIGLHDYGA